MSWHYSGFCRSGLDLPPGSVQALVSLLCPPPLIVSPACLRAPLAFQTGIKPVRFCLFVVLMTKRPVEVHAAILNGGRYARRTGSLFCTADRSSQPGLWGVGNIEPRVSSRYS